MEGLKISFCTTCMGRLHHLEKTLPKNIKDNSGYSNVEFVILNYNSKDNLDAWIKSNFSENINTGKLVYVKVDEPDYFHMSHAKNLVAKSSSGDIICNVDADNFTGKNFAKYINDMFLTHKNIFLSTNISRSPKDVCGRIAVRRKDFFEIGGYDEEMKGWGYEDEDLKKRLIAKGIKFMPIDVSYLQFLPHSNSERTLNDEVFHKIDQVWLSKLSTEEADILYMFKDGKYHFGTIVKNNTEEHRVVWVLKNDAWSEGSWGFEKNGHQLFLMDEEGNLFKKLVCVRVDEYADVSRTKVFYNIMKGESLEYAKHIYSIVSNYSIMQRKLASASGKG